MDHLIFQNQRKKAKSSTSTTRTKSMVSQNNAPPELPPRLQPQPDATRVKAKLVSRLKLRDLQLQDRIQ